MFSDLRFLPPFKRGLFQCYRYAVFSRSTVICAYSGDSSIQMQLRPVFFAANAVVPPPANGSRMTPFSWTIGMRDNISSRGLPTTCIFCFALTAMENMPGKVCRVCLASGPLAANTINSVSCLNSPSMGRPPGLCQTTMPRQENPAICSTSVTDGSWRQSVKMSTGAPFFKILQHSQSHIAIQWVKDR